MATGRWYCIRRLLKGFGRIPLSRAVTAERRNGKMGPEARETNMPMNRRELLMASVAGAATWNGQKAFAASPVNIQATIDPSRVGAPINPMIFGGYLEPATTRVWAEMLTDRKFLSPISEAPAAAPANPVTRRFAGEPFRPVGPAGTVEMDTAKVFVGTHSPRVRLAGPEPRGIQQSGLRLHKGKSYVG